MKKVKKIQAKGFYIFSGQANANSCFIEKVVHAKQFLLYANYFLKNALSIYDYVITKDGWMILVKVKSKKSLLSHYGKNDIEVWKIISERIRLFLSTFVRVTNKEKGRTGCLVHSGYKRHFFETKEEAMLYIDKIRNQKIKLYSRKKKYRALKTHYRIASNICNGSIFLCSKEIRGARRDKLKKWEVIEYVDLTDLVVEKWMNSTQILHKSQNSTSYSKNLTFISP